MCTFKCVYCFFEYTLSNLARIEPDWLCAAHAARVWICQPLLDPDLPGGTPWEDFLCFYHALHTIPAKDVDGSCRSHRLAAAGANQLPGTAGPPSSRQRVRSRLGRASGSDADDGRQAGPPDFDFVPALFQGVFDKIFSWGGIPTVLTAGHTGEAVGLGDGPEFAVVVLAAPADLLDAMLPAVQVYHLMEHGVQGFLNRIIQHLSGDIQLVRPSVCPPPHLGGGAVSVGARLALDRDNRRRQLPGVIVRIEAVIDVL